MVEVRVKAQGTIVPRDVFDLRAAASGRVETVDFSPGVWAPAGATLATMQNKTMTALMNSPTTTPQHIVKEHWAPFFKAIPAECREDCFILRRFVQPGQQVHADAALFRAAGSLELTGSVAGPGARAVKNGQSLSFWPNLSPRSRRPPLSVTRYILRESSAAPSGTFAIRMPETNWLPPGTPWSGEITVLRYLEPLAAPEGTVECVAGEAYFTMHISSGAVASTKDVENVDVRVLGGKLLMGRAKSELSTVFCQAVAPRWVLDSPLTTMEFPIKDARLRRRPPAEPDYSFDPYSPYAH